MRALVGEHVKKAGPPVWNRDLHVLQATHLSVDASGLKRAKQTEPGDFLYPQLRDLLTFEADRARVNWMISEDRVEQGGLAGPVRTDQPGNFAPWHGQGNVTVGDDTAERFCHVRKLDDCVVHSAPSACGAISMACDRTSRSLGATRIPNRSGYFSISQPTMPC